MVGSNDFGCVGLRTDIPQCISLSIWRWIFIRQFGWHSLEIPGSRDSGPLRGRAGSESTKKPTVEPPTARTGIRDGSSRTVGRLRANGRSRDATRESGKAAERPRRAGRRSGLEESAGLSGLAQETRHGTGRHGGPPAERARRGDEPRGRSIAFGRWAGNEARRSESGDPQEARCEGTRRGLDGRTAPSGDGTPTGSRCGKTRRAQAAETEDRDEEARTIGDLRVADPRRSPGRDEREGRPGRLQGRRRSEGSTGHLRVVGRTRAEATLRTDETVRRTTRSSRMVGTSSEDGMRTSKPHGLARAGTKSDEAHLAERRQVSSRGIVFGGFRGDRQAVGTTGGPGPDREARLDWTLERHEGHPQAGETTSRRGG